MCVAGCIVGYFVPGPWIDVEASFVARLFLGGFLGLLTTFGYEIIAGGIGLFKRLIKRKDAEKEAKAAGAWLDTAKKLGAILGVMAAAISGFYGAWFKPENGAQAAYQVTSEGIEALSKDVQRLTVLTAENSAARIALDKEVAISVAKLTQRLDDIEKVMERRMSYKPPVIVDEIAVSKTSSHYYAPPSNFFALPENFDGATEMMVEDATTQQRLPKIRRNGAEIEMPAAAELF
jgi:hypothetical protein